MVRTSLWFCVELEQLRLSGGVALKREQVLLRVDRDRRYAAPAFRQTERVLELEVQIRRAKFVGDEVALAAGNGSRPHQTTLA